jgi:hypothetical protein
MVLEANLDNANRSYPLKLLVIPGVVLLTQLLYSIYSHPGSINHDCAFILHGAQLILSGKHPIGGFLDMAPPLTFYSVIPVCIISDALSIPVGIIWSYLCFIAVGLTMVAATIIVRQDSEKMAARDWLLIGPLFCGFMLWHLAIGYHLGQREHLFVLSFFLMFLIRWKESLGSSVDRTIAITAGLLCGFVCFVKPYFLLIVLSLELYWFARALLNKQKQNYRLLKAPEMQAFAGIGAACLVLSFLVPNIMEYYNRIIPMVVQGYHAFDVSKQELFSFESIHGGLVGNRIFVCSTLVLAILFVRMSSLVAPLLVWSVAGLGIYALQAKGWAYHTVPMVAGYYLVASVAFALLAILSLRLMSRLNKSVDYWNPTVFSDIDQTRIYPQVATITFLFYCAFVLPSSPLLIRNSTVSAKVFPVLDDVIAKETKPLDRVMILTPNFSAAFPVIVKLDRMQATRYLWCFSIPMIDLLKKGAESAKWQAEESKFLSETATDIAEAKPKLIAIDQWNSDLNSRLLKDAGVSLALRSYEPLRSTNGFSIWKLK